jgi:uncharacterized protein (TIGR02246 family)
MDALWRPVGACGILGPARRERRLHQEELEMKRIVLLAAVAAIALRPAHLHAQAVAPDAESSKQIDADVWAVVSSTVAAGDLDGMASTYHPDAVLVNSATTATIKKTLVRWGDGMAKAKRDGTHSTVAFRFTRRQDGTDSAFESGIFALTETTAAGVSSTRFIPFEILLVKYNGKWRILMERQFDDSQRAWDKLTP